jgi:hypothetical protein
VGFRLNKLSLSVEHGCIKCRQRKQIIRHASRTRGNDTSDLRELPLRHDDQQFQAHYRLTLFNNATASSTDGDEGCSVRGDQLEDTAAFESRDAINDLDESIQIIVRRSLLHGRVLQP